MYKEIFDQKVQREMDKFFVDSFGDYSNVKWYEKGVIIDPEDSDHIYLVLEGELNQMMFSKSGKIINYYRILKGNVFGEIDYFDSERSYVVNKTIKSSKIASIERTVLEEKLKNNPQMYSYFLTSVVRKYRILMLELANHKFNDSLGRLADFLIRLYYAQDEPIEGRPLDVCFTHEDIANRIGLNRVTVTRSIKTFVDLDVIELKERNIVIKDIEGLKKVSDIPV